MSRLCLCLNSPDIERALAQIEQYRPYIDMVELRLDFLAAEQRLKAAELPARAGLPLILTARLPEDGGLWGLSLKEKNLGIKEQEEERERILIALLESGGWAYVDLEANRPLKSVAAAAQNSHTQIIRSYHDFNAALLNQSAKDLSRYVHQISAHNAIPKLAISCQNSRQLLSLARAAVVLADVKEKVLLGMGEFGRPSRILAQRLGSAWSYASPSDKNNNLPSPAAGQLDPITLQKIYRFGEIDATTPLYGILGDPIAHSRSPQFHNRWLREYNLPGSYIPLRSDDLAASLETCDLWGFKGLSITIPHKEKALQLCSHGEALTQKIGATNTLIRAGDGWRAHNTDASGFLSSLASALKIKDFKELHGLKILVIGAGGAARAAVHALAHHGVQLTILNRNLSRAKKLALEVKARYGPISPEASTLIDKKLDLIVQASSLGMFPQENKDPLPWLDLTGLRLVYDMIYVPQETPLLVRARKAGIPTQNGALMLEQQARLQFQLFTGSKNH